MSVASVKNGEKSCGAGGEVGNDAGGILVRVRCAMYAEEEMACTRELACVTKGRMNSPKEIAMTGIPVSS